MSNAEVMSRRVTGSEESDLRAAARRRDAAMQSVRLRQAELDQLAADIAAAGGRISDIAEILGVSRPAVYDAIERTKEQSD
jgi:transcriptional regulator of acetoin/glycerol metabolism